MADWATGFYQNGVDFGIQSLSPLYGGSDYSLSPANLVSYKVEKFNSAATKERCCAVKLFLSSDTSPGGSRCPSNSVLCPD